MVALLFLAVKNSNYLFENSNIKLFDFFQLATLRWIVRRKEIETRKLFLYLFLKNNNICAVLRCVVVLLVSISVRKNARSIIFEIDIWRFVFVAFRRGFNDIRAVPEEAGMINMNLIDWLFTLFFAEAAKEERCEWMPFCAPKQVMQMSFFDIFRYSFVSIIFRVLQRWFTTKMVTFVRSRCTRPKSTTMANSSMCERKTRSPFFSLKFSCLCV